MIRSSHVEAPTQIEVKGLAPDEVRNRPAHVTLARALRIQPKDAPIVTLAVKHAIKIEAAGSDEQVTIVTSDRSFGELEPSEYDLRVEMKYLSYPKRGTPLTPVQ